MKNFKSYVPVIISLIISSFIIVGYNYINTDNKKDITKEYYNVYLDGKLLGSIKSKTSLENYINKEQKNLKKQYDVDKVYVPNGIDIQKGISHNPKIVSEKTIYNKIKTKKGFNIKGYIVTINSKDKNSKEKIEINLLDKSLFNKAVTRVVKSFVDSNTLKNYRNDTQTQIKTTGSLIENIDIDQNISIRQSFISTEDVIYLDVDSLTKYLLFGSSNSESEYTVKPGDTIETVAFNNKLNEEEFLIVNPEFTSSKNLLTPGQIVNVALINPILDIVVEKHVVEDQDKPYETEEKEDANLESGQTRVEVEGVNGRQRVTEKIKYVNGEIAQSVIVNSETLKEPTNRVLVKGTKVSSSSYSNYYSSNEISYVNLGGDWGWPTISPYIVTSEFKWRWGRLHAGIDISSSFGSPIFSVGNGTVVDTVSSCPGHGYYGSSCGGGYGNVIFVDYGGGVLIKYGHLNSVNVGVGQSVSRGQIIGTMGNSGSSTGTHLHYEIRVNGAAVNPRSLY